MNWLYSLIIVVQYNVSVSTTTLIGFQTEQDCQAAAVKWAQEVRRQTEVKNLSAVCVKRGTPLNS